MAGPEHYGRPRNGAPSAAAVFRTLLDDAPADGWLTTSDLRIAGDYGGHLNSAPYQLMARWAGRGWLECDEVPGGTGGALRWRLTPRGRWEARKWLDREGRVTTWQDRERERARLRAKGIWPTGQVEW